MGRHKKNAAASSGYVPKKIPALEGTADIITETDILWEAVLGRFARIARTYGFSRVEAPLLEDQYLYESFYKNSKPALAGLLPVTTAAGRPAALRPSLLPSALRCYYQHKIFDKTPLSKWFYSGWTARAGADRELESDFQFGFELFGGYSHLSEAQLIGAIWEFIKSLELKDAVLEINNIGGQATQKTYQDALKDFLSGKKYELCDNCNDALQIRPLDVFRCDKLDCQSLLSEAPTVLDFLEPDCHKQFTQVLEALDELGIPYQLNPLYAGPEGFGKTNFVIKYKTKDKLAVIGEGGSHDDYMQSLCGKAYSCFGFTGSAGLLRRLLEEGKIGVNKELKNDVFLVPLGELASKKSLKLFRDLTSQRVSVYDHFGECGVKNQLKQAVSYNAPIALIMGQKEAMDEMVILRDVKSGMQEIISYDKIVEEVKKRLGK